MRIGLYGGSFDPIHLGHLLVAQAAVEELALDRLAFIPASQSPFKPELAPTSGAMRVRMLRLALAGLAHADVDEQELERGGISYSIDTVRTYAARFDGATFYWLIGADHVVSLPRWREATVLAAMIEFVVIPRPGTAPVALPSPFRLRHLRGFPLSVSSSEIRERARCGLSLEPLVPSAVAEVIREENLYASRTDGSRNPCML